MDIEKEREAFEKLPEIAERLHTVFYNKDLDQYHAAMINSGLSVKYIQGAWYAWQAAKAKAVPEGFVLVSKEPTQDQLEYGYRCGSTDAKRIYSAMITSYEDY